MNYFGKMKEYASKASNLAEKYLNDGSKPADDPSEVEFLKDKVAKLEGTIRSMTQVEAQLN